MEPETFVQTANHPRLQPGDNALQRGGNRGDSGFAGRTRATEVSRASATGILAGLKPSSERRVAARYPGLKPGVLDRTRRLTEPPHASAWGTLGLALLLAATITGCTTQAETPEKTFVTMVRTAEVMDGADPLPIQSSGRLSPKTSMQLSFKTGGVIESIPVDEGDRVRAGQTLARLDLSEIDAQVAQAQSAFDKAERDYSRMRNLYADSVVTLEQLENTETAKTVAASNLKVASFNRQHSVIVAPANGRIERRFAEPNELVGSGRPILALGASAGWVVRLGLSDRDVVRLQLNDKAVIRLDAYPERSFEGTVTEIAEAADNRSGTFEVEVGLTGTEKAQASPPGGEPGGAGRGGGFLKSGFIASVELFPSEQSAHKTIPIEAIVEGDGSTAVIYTVEPESGRAKRLTVQIAAIYDDHVAVASGLEGVDVVVTDGAQYLTDGAATMMSDEQ